MKHFIPTLLLVTGISATCIAAAQFTAEATSTTGASLSPTGANMTNTVNPNTLTGAQIMQIQQTLRNDGVSVNVDGVWSPGMTAALNQFQTAHGLTASGTLTAQTVTDLGVNLSANTPAGSANFGSSTSSNLSNTTGENQIQNGNAAGMNTLSPAAGSNTIGTDVTSPNTSPTSPTGPGNTITGGVGGATGTAGTGGTNAGVGGSTGGVGGATGSAGTGGAAGR